LPRTRLFITCLACVLPLLAACGGGSAEEPPPGNETVSFALDVLPLFQQECTVCHGGSGGLFLDTYAGVIAGGDSGAVVVPGDPDASLLPQRLDGSIPPQMPLDGDPLSGPEIDIIRQWILEGALDN
jgi:hypothetical protein